jgi:two-component system, sensor histidine kinase and response regulator
MTDRPKLLYLDDEENNLFAFKALFRRDYDVFTTTSAQEAVEYLNQNEVPVILSDQKMPDLSGVEFFELTVPNFPNAVRILVTGYADMEAVIDAINRGQVYRYVTKPWDESELKITIDNALEKYNAAKELSERTRELEKAHAELERFVYSASHDLRAPLVSIKGVLRVAALEGVEPKAAGYLQMIEQSVEKLDVFVQNIIHFYQNAQSEELLSVVQLDTVLQEVVDGLGRMKGASEMKITRELACSGVFRTDVHRLKMVLGQLVSNAIRYRDPAKEEHTLRIQVVQNAERAVIKVEDNGLGIALEEQGRIFEMFFRSSDSESAGVGAGVGLYIARQAVLKLGGKINVLSEPAIFTRFIIDIPNKA